MTGVLTAVELARDEVSVAAQRWADRMAASADGEDSARAVFDSALNLFEATVRADEVSTQLRRLAPRGEK